MVNRLPDWMTSRLACVSESDSVILRNSNGDGHGLLLTVAMSMPARRPAFHAGEFNSTESVNTAPDCGMSAAYRRKSAGEEAVTYSTVIPSNL